MSNGVAPFKLLWVVNKTDETLNYIDETEYSYWHKTSKGLDCL